MDREQIQQAYIRICKDSGFGLSSTDAAKLAARVIGCHPLDFLTVLGFDNMQRIANGSHPVCKPPTKGE